MTCEFKNNLRQNVIPVARRSNYCHVAGLKIKSVYRISSNKRPRSNERPRPEKRLAPRPLYQIKQGPSWISAPHSPPRLTFLNSRDARKTCFYCRFIYNFWNFNTAKSVQEKGFFFVPVISFSIWSQSSFMCFISSVSFFSYYSADLTCTPSIKRPSFYPKSQISARALVRGNMVLC